MRQWIYLCLLPVLLLAKRIELGQNFSKDPTETWMIDAPIREVLDKLKIDLVASDLHHDLHSPDIAYVVVWNWPPFLQRSDLNRLPKKKSLLFAWEPPSVQPDLYSEEFLRHFHRIYTWDDDLVDGKRFFKFYYPALVSMAEVLPSFEERKFLTFMYSNKKSKHPHQLYSARRELIEFFEDKPEGEFEFYGFGWKKKNYRNYRGEAADKVATLKNYKFCIAYENIRDIKGYVTEKIFDCFAAGCVPIYWGASNVEEYIPQECFIDRRKFQSNEELYAFLKSIDQATYDTYLAAIRSFLKSEKAQKFSKEMFYTIFLEAVRCP